MTSSYFDWLRNILLFCVYVTGSSFGLYLLKEASSWWSVKFAIGFLLYGMGALLWLLILRFFPLSIAFPIAAGSLMIATTLIGVTLLQEVVTISHIIGILLIISGIFFIAMKGLLNHG
jgi:multidrug transporter EmrE-like cation transporter